MKREDGGGVRCGIPVPCGGKASHPRTNRLRTNHSRQRRDTTNLAAIVTGKSHAIYRMVGRSGCLCADHKNWLSRTWPLDVATWPASLLVGRSINRLRHFVDQFTSRILIHLQLLLLLFRSASRLFGPRHRAATRAARGIFQSSSGIWRRRFWSAQAERRSALAFGIHHGAIEAQRTALYECV